MTAAPLPLGQLTTPELARLHLATGDWATRFYLAVLSTGHQAAALPDHDSEEYRDLRYRRAAILACASEVEDVAWEARGELAARRAVLKEVTRA